MVAGPVRPFRFLSKKNWGAFTTWAVEVGTKRLKLIQRKKPNLYTRSKVQYFNFHQIVYFFSSGKTTRRRHFPTSTSLRKVILLHNLSRLNTRDKLTLEDVVIIAMIRSKCTFFFRNQRCRIQEFSALSSICSNLVSQPLSTSSKFLHIIMH